MFKTFLEMNIMAIIIYFRALILILYAVIVKSQRFRIYFTCSLEVVSFYRALHMRTKHYLECGVNNQDSVYTLSFLLQTSSFFSLKRLMAYVLA